MATGKELDELLLQYEKWDDKVDNNERDGKHHERGPKKDDRERGREVQRKKRGQRERSKEKTREVP